MKAAHYPAITDASLTPFRAIEIQLKADPTILDRAECPYPPLIKAFLRRMIGGELVALRGDGGQDGLLDAAENDLDVEIASLYRTVKTDAANYVGTDMKDKMSFLKTSNDLLTKIVDLQGKRFSIKNYAKAQRAFIEVLEEYMTPAQRSEIVEKLAVIADV